MYPTLVRDVTMLLHGAPALCCHIPLTISKPMEPPDLGAKLISLHFISSPWSGILLQ
jgi:hypothetical protein